VDNPDLITDKTMPLMLMAMEAAPDISVDTEASGLNVRNGLDFLTGFCIDVPGMRGYLPFRHNKGTNLSFSWLEPLEKILQDKDLIWHNRKFDMHSVKTIGIDPLKFRGKQYCTMIGAHSLNEEWFSKELDFLAKKLLGEEKDGADAIKKLGELYGWENIPPEVIATYGAQDATLTRRLRDYIWPRLARESLESVYWATDEPFTVLLYKIEQRGVGVNRELALELGQRGRARMETIHRSLRFNPASTTDLGRYLLDELGLPILAVTPKGKPSFNKVAMEGYDEILQASANPTAKLIAEYRGWQKATTSLYEPLLRKVGPDGRVRTEFKQHGTVTKRLSASNPNLQQVPRGSDKPWNGRAKGCFTSGYEGFALYGWDYSQIELRLAAAYGKERRLLTEFEKADSDPFSVYCEILFGQFSQEGRQNTKTFFYANLYGAQLARIAATLGWSEEQTAPIFNKFKASIPGIQEVARRCNDAMRQQKYITYWDGSKRHIKNPAESYKAWNSLIQGGAAQIVKKAMLRCEEFADSDCYPVLTVHDEITFVVRREAIPDYEPKIVKAMTEFKKDDGVTDLFPVKFAVEGKEWKAAA
jgi:DNA polymerase-1